MKNKLILSSFILTFGFLFFSSCNKIEDVENKVKKNAAAIPTLLQYYNQISGDKDGVCGLVGWGGYATQDVDRAGFDGYFFGDNGEKEPVGTIEVSSLDVGNLDLNPTKRNTYYVNHNDDFIPYFGQNTSFTIQGETTEFYIPTLIKIQSPVLFRTTTIGANQKITWNKDSNNSKGVLFVLYYLPSDPQNTPFAQTGYDKPFSTAIWTEDTGEYTFNTNDFEGFPDGTYVNFRILRANFTNLTIENDKKILVYGYSKNSGDFTYDAN